MNKRKTIQEEITQTKKTILFYIKASNNLEELNQEQAEVIEKYFHKLTRLTTKAEILKNDEILKQ